jgi:peptide/nickel transport system substrate-binding protein
MLPTLKTGGRGNTAGYSNAEVDRLLDAARVELDIEKRRELYAQVLRISLGQDANRIYLWHRKNIMAHQARLVGYRPIADGMIRLQGMRFN